MMTFTIILGYSNVADHNTHGIVCQASTQFLSM